MLLALVPVPQGNLCEGSTDRIHEVAYHTVSCVLAAIFEPGPSAGALNARSTDVASVAIFAPTEHE